MNLYGQRNKPAVKLSSLTETLQVFVLFLLGCNHSFSNLGKTSAATCFSTRHVTYVAKCDVQTVDHGALTSLLLLLLLLLLLHGGSVFSSWISSTEPSHHIFLRLTHRSEQISGIYSSLFYSRRSSLRNVETTLSDSLFFHPQMTRWSERLASI